jgi:hypothetical protein
MATVFQNLPIIEISGERKNRDMHTTGEAKLTETTPRHCKDWEEKKA